MAIFSPTSHRDTVSRVIRSRKRLNIAATSVASLSILLTLSMGAVGATTPIPPGTASQVTTLVNQSVSITRMNSTVQALLPHVVQDNWGTQFHIPTGTTCGFPVEFNCVYGNTTATKTVVL